jgi:A/G-specific adenine glycosylase
MNKKRSFNFSSILLKWNTEENTREMPWKREKDPYKIWLSEVILQQTRVEQGLGYYENFIKAFPTVHRLADAHDDKIYKSWEGLGYYSRCRNLIETARHVSKNLSGNFPDNYGDIKKLKGVGPYTASAISSFAFNLPHAVVDGNVFRVLSRVFNIKLAIDSTVGKKYFTRLANELIDKKNPALYNQAIMDLGAVVCKPVPLCDQCPFQKYCKAYLAGKIAERPVKNKTITIQKRWFYYLAITYNKNFAIRRRMGKDIWQNLFEFPLIETAIEYNPKDILRKAEKEKILRKKGYAVVSVSEIFKQQLSHQLICGRFINIELNRKINMKALSWLDKKEMKKLAFPKFINQWMQKQL